MKIIRHPDEMKNLSVSFQRSGRKIGFVPTMGALHEGHLSLLDRAMEVSDVGVMSIFVNPAQFGLREDFGKYPRPFERDCEMAAARGCDIVFAPQADDMYPQNYKTYVEVNELGRKLCGVSRSGHFKGVATVVLKLLNIVMPQAAVFGQKDAQQAIILKRMIRDLNMSVQIIVAPIVRETDGLAMSSRNAYLSPEERREAGMIFRGLGEAKRLYYAGERDSDTLRGAILGVYAGASMFSPEYVEIVDTVELNPVARADSPTLIAVACKTAMTGTRLIDNIIVGGAL